VADAKNTFELTGNGDVLEPFHGVMGIGSGGMFAQGKRYVKQCLRPYMSFIAIFCYCDT
jgi:ATP-dependent protease HslVU (ClpYQ) peptidase subunit